MPTDALQCKHRALLVLTRSGLELALRLQNALEGETHIYAHPRAFMAHQQASSGAASCFTNLKLLLVQLWSAQDALVLFFALGAAVRLIAPHLQDKRTDPAVVVIDDAARFAISVVSGHTGGANELASRCAAILGAQPIITTASEVRQTLAIDMLAQEQGWYMEETPSLTAVAAATVNGERIAVFQDAGAPDWQFVERSSTANLIRIAHLDELESGGFAALLLISDRLPAALPPALPTVIYRPPTLVLGVGCRRGVPFAELDAWIKATLQAEGIAFHSISVLASATLKGDEEGLLLLAQHYGWSFEVYTPEALVAMTDVPGPSERVRQLVGTPSVSEAAALLSSKGGELVLSKRKGNGMTLAVARKSCTKLEQYIAPRECAQDAAMSLQQGKMEGGQ